MSCRRSRFVFYSALVALLLGAIMAEPAWAGVGQIAAIVRQLLGGTPPSNSGTSGYVLTTNGAGTLSWAAPSGGGETLAQTLVLGNSTGGTNLNVTAGDRILFGGTTSSFPALKRNSAALQIRLADDSGYANLDAANFNANSGTYTLGLFGALAAQSDGVWRLTDNAGTTFGRIQLGGTSSSFPSIKRSSTTVAFRLADDSADAPISASSATLSDTLALASGKGVAWNSDSGIFRVGASGNLCTTAGSAPSASTGSISGGFATGQITLGSALGTGAIPAPPDPTLYLLRLNDSGNNVRFQFGTTSTTASLFAMSNHGNMAWYSGTVDGSSADTNVSRVGAGILGIGTGAQASAAGTLRVTTVQAPSSTALSLGGNATTRMQLTSAGNVVTNATGSNLAQNATDGFLYVPVCATGAPSGTPTSVTGATALVAQGDTLYFRGTSAWQALTASGGASGLPTRYKSGLLYSYLSTTTLSISTGKCRNSADSADMTLSSAVTLDKATAGAIQGTDEKDSGTTATTHGTTTFEPASSIVSALGTRSPTFTSFSSSTTTVTGVGTKFLTEVAVNDLVGNSSVGYSRVTAIASDTSLTIVAAFPGGDAGGGSVGLVVIENATVWPGVIATDKRQINTLDAAGTSVVVGAGALSSNGSGVALKVGVLPLQQIQVNVWLVSGGSGTGTCLSTQRTTPYTLTGYTTSARRLGGIPLTTSGTFMLANQREVSPFVVETIFEEANAGNNTSVLSNGTANATWTPVVLSAVVPPSARQAYLTVSQAGASSPRLTYIRERNVGSSTVSRNNVVGNSVNSVATYGHVWVNCDGAQAIDYSNNNSTSSTTIWVVGFRETL